MFYTKGLRLSRLLTVLIVILFSSVSFSQEIDCGDIDGNQDINILDVTYFIGYIYFGGPAPLSMEAADVDLNGDVNLLDICWLISYLYLGGPVPCGVTQWPDGQDILFDVSYAVFGWIEQFTGFYIDGEGYIHAFNNTGYYWNPPNPDTLSLGELLSKYGSMTYIVDSIDLEELRLKYSYVVSASMGPLSERVNVCYDMGGYEYSAYIYDPDSGKYIRVLLNLAGDWAQKNFHPSAEYLYEWLQTIDEFYANPPCQYSE